MVTAFDWIVYIINKNKFKTIQSNALTNFGHARHQCEILPPWKERLRLSTQLLPLACLKTYILVTLEVYLTLKNLSVDNECKCQVLSLIYPYTRNSRPSSPWSCILRNWSRLGLKMYIFLTLEFDLL